MEEDFEQTEAVMSDASSVPVLTEAERHAMRQFCLHSLRLQESMQAAAEERKEIANIVKEKRAKLQDWIRKQDKKCFMLPKHMYREMETELGAKGLGSLPPFLRLQRNTSDAAITPAVAESAVMDLDFESVEERAQTETKNLTKALVDAIVNAARTTVRSTKEAVALSESMEKGLKPIQVEELPEEIARDMFDMHKAQQLAKQKSSSTREATSDVSQTLKRLQPTVQSVLEKTGRNAQQVQLEGVQGTHKIVKRVSSRAAKITLALFEDTVSNAVMHARIPSDSLQSMWLGFQAHKKDIVRAVQLKLSSLPKKETTNIKLVSKRLDGTDIEEEDEKEEEDEQ